MEDSTTYLAETSRLLLTQDGDISLTYYKAWRLPDDFAEDRHDNMNLMIEKNLSITCSSSKALFNMIYYLQQHIPQVTKIWQLLRLLSYKLVQFQEGEEWICQSIFFWEEVQQPSQALAMEISTALFDNVNM